MIEMKQGLGNGNGTRGKSRVGLGKLLWGNKVGVPVWGCTECNRVRDFRHVE